MPKVKDPTPWVYTCAPEKTFNGYTLMAPMGGSVAWLIDMQGNPVHCWQMPYPVEGFGLAIKPDGKLVYGGRDVTSKKPGQPVNVPVIVEADWDGNILWEHRDPQQHHAFPGLIMEILWFSNIAVFLHKLRLK